MKRAWLPSPDRERGVVLNAVGWRKRQRKQVLYFVVISLMLDQSGDSKKHFTIMKDVFAIQSKWLAVGVCLNSMMKSYL